MALIFFSLKYDSTFWWIKLSFLSEMNVRTRVQLDEITEKKMYKIEKYNKIVHYLKPKELR